ncbi:hypothetical protein BJY00DRAFT_315320 [Aspergillus carlsbadensis]|nr:hypothetical protein BJY00DRAFT_315320 [Aspergillus carlsbadensis]
MKLTLILATTLLALTPTASAWRVRFYENSNYGGREHTRAGNGNPGTRCHGAPNPINNKVSSFKFWPKNTAGDTSCCLELYNGLNCDPATRLNNPTSCHHTERSNLAGTNLQDRISSYRTTCVYL